MLSITIPYKIHNRFDIEDDLEYITMLTNDEFPEKEFFPHEIQQFYLTHPKSFAKFPQEYNRVCLLVDADEIDNNKSGIFSEYGGKRPDQIHYSVGIGLIEEKSNNFGLTDIEGKFSQFKYYFEKKYASNKLCKVKYCVLTAFKLSEKMQTELTINKSDNTLVYLHSKNKQFKIGNTPVYFIKKRRK